MASGTSLDLATAGAVACGKLVADGDAQQEDDVAKKNKDRFDPSWPKIPGRKTQVSELVSERQGAMSPFGDTTFPVDASTLEYTHPGREDR